MMTLPLHALKQQARSIAQGAPAWPHLPAIARGRVVGNTLSALQTGDAQALNDALTLQQEPHLQQLAAAKTLLRRLDAGERIPTVPDRQTLLRAVKYQQGQVLAQHRHAYLKGLPNRDIFQLLINAAHVAQRPLKKSLGMTDRFTGITTKQSIQNDQWGEIEELVASPLRQDLRQLLKRSLLNYIFLAHGRGKNLSQWSTVYGHPVQSVLQRLLPPWREALTWVCINSMLTAKLTPSTWKLVVNNPQQGVQLIPPLDVYTAVKPYLKSQFQFENVFTSPFNQLTYGRIPRQDEARYWRRYGMTLSPEGYLMPNAQHPTRRRPKGNWEDIVIMPATNTTSFLPKVDENWHLRRTLGGER